MDLSPPVGWTYFPPKTEALKSIINGCGFVQSSDNYQIWYFVGQSNDSLIAKQRANSEITASSVTEIGVLYPPRDVRCPAEAMTSFVNAERNTRGAGPRYGKVEGGAVTQTAPGGMGTGDFVFTAYTKLVRVTLSNAAGNRYTWNIVKNTFMQKLSLGFNARFNGEVTISRN
ncbi:unnamed protein product [Angiostrongylus costaricensis]|uniref:Lipocalin-like domain-containing protein n=1 Tax=Angiostrongylus costaricensis TaxID=334426 RepID=A0A0R3PSS5_ANGCS|nr:unnamed protein product [Angiostrongylus costaricensis]